MIDNAKVQAEAEKILNEVLVLKQEEPNLPRAERNTIWELLEMKIEHFLRRDEEDSHYYGKFEV